MAAQYESIKLILDRLLRNDILSGISFESVIDYTIDFMEIMSVPSIFIEKLYEGDIKDYRADLPCDFVEDIQVILTDSIKNLSYNTPARSATDTFHNHYNCSGIRHTSEPTFSINRSYIYTSIEKGKVSMVYTAVPTDEEGYPMIPSDRTFLEALEWYIKYKYYTILWEQGKLEDKRYENTKQEYSWAVARYSSSVKKMSLSKAESFFNVIRSLVPRNNEFNKRFQNTGTKEYIRRH